MKEPLVSVVIPSFNRDHCIERTLNSVLSQTYSNWEVLLIDDGSTDLTREIISKNYKDEKRIKYFYQENQGVSVARNNGLRRARGEFIALLDSDDVWKPWKLESQVRCLEELPNVGMIWSDMEALDPDGSMIHQKYLVHMYSAYSYFTLDELFSESVLITELIQCPGNIFKNCRVFWGDIYSNMVMGNLVHTSTVLLRKSRLKQVKGFNEQLKFTGEDYDFHLRTCQFGPVAFMDISSIEYQTGLPDQLTRPEYAYYMAFNFLQTIRAAFKVNKDRIDLPLPMIRNLWLESYKWVGRTALDKGEKSLARHYFLKSFHYKLWQPKTAALILLSALPTFVSDNLVKIYGQLKRRNK